MSQPHIPFKWDYDASQIENVHFRLYEDGEMIVDNIGELNFNLLMDDKDYKNYEYYVTAVRTDFDIESEPSNPYTVNFTRPAAPTNFRAEWVAGSETSVSGSVG